MCELCPFASPNKKTLSLQIMESSKMSKKIKKTFCTKSRLISTHVHQNFFPQYQHENWNVRHSGNIFIKRLSLQRRHSQTVTTTIKHRQQQPSILNKRVARTYGINTMYLPELQSISSLAYFNCLSSLLRFTISFFVKFLRNVSAERKWHAGKCFSKPPVLADSEMSADL